VRLTQDEVVSHPLWQNFGSIEAQHPPMRGWLASSIGGEDGRIYGLLQLTDESRGRDFDADDEGHIRELAALVGAALDALRAASAISCETPRG
jgi:GAF domain-containing protein